MGEGRQCDDALGCHRCRVGGVAGERPLHRGRLVVVGLRLEGWGGNGQHHLHISIIGAVADDDVYRVGLRGHGIADDRCRGIVFLSVDGGGGDVRVGLHAHHGTCCRGHGECGAGVHLAPVGPVAVGDLAGRGVEVELHVDGRGADGGLRDIDALGVLIGHERRAVLALEVEEQRRLLGGVGQRHGVVGEHRRERHVALRSGDGLSGLVALGAVGPCREGLASHEECAVLWQRIAAACCHGGAGGRGAQGGHAAQTVGNGHVGGQLRGVGGLHGKVGHIVATGDGQRGGLTAFVVAADDIGRGVLVVASAGVGAEGCHRGAGSVLYRHVASPGTGAEGDLHRPCHGHGGREVLPAVIIGVVLAADGRHGVAGIGGHAAHGAVGCHGQSHGHGRLARDLICRQQITIHQVGLETGERTVRKGCGCHKQHQAQCAQSL